MRARRLSLVMVLGVLLLAGCVPQQVEDPAEPAPSATPVFASEEEALAAAVAAYEAYLKVSDEIAADGGANPERLKDLVTDEWYEKEVEAFQVIQELGLWQSGYTSSRSAELQSVIDSGKGATAVIINVCADSSSTALLDDSGNDVTPPGRVVLVTTEVEFSGSEDSLKLSRNSPWSTDSLC